MLRLSNYRIELFIIIFWMSFFIGFISTIYISFSRGIVTPIIVSLVFGSFVFLITYFLSKVVKVFYLSKNKDKLVIRNVFSKKDIEIIDNIQIRDTQVNFWTKKTQVFLENDKIYTTYLAFGKKNHIMRFTNSK